jgi:hypothetical protein
LIAATTVTEFVTASMTRGNGPVATAARLPAGTLSSLIFLACIFCGMPACAYQLQEEDKISLCVNHIPIDETRELPVPGQQRVPEQKR